MSRRKAAVGVARRGAEHRQKWRHGRDQPGGDADRQQLRLHGQNRAGSSEQRRSRVEARDAGASREQQQQSSGEARSRRGAGGGQIWLGSGRGRALAGRRLRSRWVVDCRRCVAAGGATNGGAGVVAGAG
ncbi:hypothetical protein ACJRO7_005567 [Eucalyptus globulus]|uniref:Uncharacterized protein n=1 Tax=Eucalyptus globulus TaxID=34317 RepID=A0ABD3J297_EUCGL